MQAGPGTESHVDPAATSAGQVPREAGLSYARFVRDYLVPRRPVILEGALADQPALKKWSPAFLKERFGSRPIVLADGTESTIGAYVDRIESPELDPKRPPPLVRNQWLSQLFPELVTDFQTPSYFRPNWFDSRWLRPIVPKVWRPWVEFFLGPRGGRFPNVHVDLFATSAWSAQIYGAKKFWFWPPRAGQGLGKLLVKVDRLREDWDQHLDGLHDHARPTTLVLEAGDTLFIPPGWWHTTEIVRTSITLSGNFVNDTNWEEYRRGLELHQAQLPANTPLPNGDAKWTRWQRLTQLTVLRAAPYLVHDTVARSRARST